MVLKHGNLLIPSSANFQHNIFRPFEMGSYCIKAWHFLSSRHLRSPIWFCYGLEWEIWTKWTRAVYPLVVGCYSLKQRKRSIEIIGLGPLSLEHAGQQFWLANRIEHPTPRAVMVQILLVPHFVPRARQSEVQGFSSYMGQFSGKTHSLERARQTFRASKRPGAEFLKKQKSLEHASHQTNTH